MGQLQLHLIPIVEPILLPVRQLESRKPQTADHGEDKQDNKECHPVPYLESAEGFKTIIDS